MANSWLRLWHDMPNDPKWRTIARISKQSIPAVLAVYVHLLVIASTANERGRTQKVSSDDLASALDLDTNQVDAILDAMQGRVLDGDIISGWAKRQVGREDGSAERAKRWREAQKEASRTQPNATERNRTPDKDKDKDKDKELKDSPLPPKLDVSSAKGSRGEVEIPDWIPSDAWHGYLEMRVTLKKPATPNAQRLVIKKLKLLMAQGSPPRDVLEQSIINSWQGIFKVKDHEEHKPGNQERTSIVERVRIANGFSADGKTYTGSVEQDRGTVLGAHD